MCGIPNFIDRLIHGSQAGDALTLLNNFRTILLAGSPSSPGLVIEIEEHNLPVLHFVSSTRDGPSHVERGVRHPGSPSVP